MKTKLQSLPIETLIARTKTNEQLESALAFILPHRESEKDDENGGTIAAIGKENRDPLSDEDVERLLNIELNKSKPSRYRLNVIRDAAAERGLRLDEGDEDDIPAHELMEMIH